MNKNSNSSTTNNKSDIKLRQWLFYTRTCAQIRQLEAEVAEYTAFKSTIESLKGDLNTYKIAFVKIYNLTCDGMSCAELTPSITKIKDYSTDIDKKIDVLGSIIDEIKEEISKRQTNISSLRAQI